jgi:tetratricopeptide (TPR) repeat protein
MTRGYRGDADLPPGPARDLVDLLRRLRQYRGLSVGQIAVRAGLSRSHVSEILRGWKTPSPDAAASIAGALGASDSEASKARQWAGLAGEARYYQRAGGAPLAAVGPPRAVGRDQRRRRADRQPPAASDANHSPVTEELPAAIGYQADPGLAGLADHVELVPRLQSLAAQHPLREDLQSQLMLALYQCGRLGEALDAYRRARDILAADLGVEPGPGLRDLHQRILSADPALTPAGPAPPSEGRPEKVTPRELPPTVPGFTGRSAEFQALTGLLDRAGEGAAGAVVTLAIGGTAGVGKTALAVHWAHQVAGRFRDGQLYVNLRGYDPGQPMPAADALARFLRSLGVSGEDIPPETDERAARYRSLLAGKRMLVVLDNAGSADQVRPLLPGSPASTVLVTSRDALAGLVARDGAARLDLDVLPQQEAVALLRTLIGARVDAEPGAAAELAGQCCRLPLALRVAAELAASRPAASLTGLAAELADLRTRLDLLAADSDPRTQVRAVFSWSYRHLDADAARTFRLLGLHPGSDVEPYAAAALTDTPLAQARRALDLLARAHLVSPGAQGRFSMHDLLRAYACELTTTLDTEAERHAGLTRLFDHYLRTAVTAIDILYPGERHRRPSIPEAATPVPPLDDPAAAREWLDAERATLVAATGHAAAHGWPGHATRLAATVSRDLRKGGHLPEALTIFSYALDAARRTGDRAAEATALSEVGAINWRQGRLQQAGDHSRRALALFRAVGDRAGEADELGNLGHLEAEQGRYEQAARRQEDAVAIWRDLGDRSGEARALGDLGVARRLQGRYREAAGHYQRTLDLFREVGDRLGEALTLARLGVVDLRLGRHQHAARYLRQALAVFHEMGDTTDETETLIRLGEVDLGLGRYAQAAGNFEQALATSREIGDPGLEADALNGLGEVLFQTGEAGKARAHHATALRLVSEASLPREQARSHSCLARIYQEGGDSLQAQHHWQEALTRYAGIGAPEANEIRARLAMTDDDCGDNHKPTEEDGGSRLSHRSC